MTQTTTGVTACNVGIRITDATGAYKDISGSTNKIVVNGAIKTEKKYTLGSVWPRRFQGGRDVSIEVNIIYSTAADEGWAILKAWYFASTPGTRSVSLNMPDPMEFPAHVKDLTFDAKAGDGEPVMVQFTLQAVYKKWWLAQETISESSCVIAHSPFGAANLAASYLNLNDPGTSDAVVGVAPTLAADTVGWVFDGLTTYLKSFTATTGVDWSMMVSYTVTASTGRRTVAGKYQTNTNMFSVTPNWTPGEMWARHGGHLDTAPILLSGTYGFSAATAYRNGVAEPGTIPTPATTTGQFFIGALGALSIPLEFWPGSIKRIAVYSLALTPAQMLILHGEMV